MGAFGRMDKGKRSRLDNLGLTLILLAEKNRIESRIASRGN